METAASRATGWLAAAWWEILTIVQIRFVPPEKRDAVLFALRGWGASMLALYLAFYLQLDEPYWAPLTVWIVLQPTPGMSISKAFYRTIGTIVGSFMGVVLVCLFIQVPELFIAALALWVGTCTLVGNLLRNFRAYGAVMAGFTAAVIACGSINTPESVIDIALARCAATLIGIGCATLLTALFAPHRARQKVRALTAKAITDAIQRMALPVTSTMAERIALGKPLIDELIALDAEIDYAAAESAGVRIHEAGARSLLAHLFGALAAKRSLEEELMHEGAPTCPGLGIILADTMKLLESVPQMIAADRWLDIEKDLEKLRMRLKELDPEQAATGLEKAVSSRVVIDRLDEMLNHLTHAINDWQRLLGGWVWRPSLSLNFHRDLRMAIIHGLRAALTIGLAGAFWIASAWDQGPSLLIWISVGASFFASAPQPELLGKLFLKLVMIAVVVAFFVNFLLLQNTTGFPLLAVSYGFVLVPAATLLYNLRNPVPVMAFCANFIALSRPTNVMDYDAASYFNNAIALYLGVGAGVLAYSLFMPPNPQASRRYVVYRIRLGLERISRINPIPPFSAWQTRMFDRINRLHNPENPAGWPTNEWFIGGLAALSLGNEVLRLRHLLEEGRLGAKVTRLARTVLLAFANITSNPDPARHAVHAALLELEQTTPGESDDRQAWLRVSGIFRKMEVFFTEHPVFLAGKVGTI